MSGASIPGLEPTAVFEKVARGASHSVFVNRKSRKASAVPGHREINEHLARKICRDLEVPLP